MYFRIGLWFTAIILLSLSYPESPWYRWWLVELAGAFYLWFASVTLILFMIIGWVRSPFAAPRGRSQLEKNILLSSLAIALTFYSSTILPWYIPHNQAAKNSGTPLTVMTYNVNHKQWDLAQVEATVRAHPVDIFGLVEPQKDQAAALRETVTDLYPYYYRATGGGTSLFSRYPMQSPRTENFGAQDHSLIADFEIAGQPLQLILTHPFVPISLQYFRRRNELISAIAHYAQQNPAKTLIVMGDFNATPWSAYLREFVRVSGLHNVALGYGFKPTWFYWSTSQPFSLKNCIKQLFKIPIDHIFVSPNIAVEEMSMLPSGASDHRPLWAKLDV
ncbi:MAG: endonuclease/exonuclease/phosphatase family protein [Spirulina sp. SIO3F2]|nr:endonuclease/exonuclease/phosphatase family protein [Spirulina sp. SIO3F2]